MKGELKDIDTMANEGGSWRMNLMKGGLKALAGFFVSEDHPPVESHEGRIERDCYYKDTALAEWYLESHEGRIESSWWWPGGR